jgi:hypothetical protein
MPASCGGVFPHFDSNPLFSRLLAGDEEKGFCDVTLAKLAQSQSDHLPNTAIVETVLTAAAGAKLRVTDFAPRFERFASPGPRRCSMRLSSSWEDAWAHASS